MALPGLQSSFFLSRPKSARSKDSTASKNWFTITCCPAAVPPPFATAGKWSIDCWRTKKGSQLPKHQNQTRLVKVMEEVEEFPPLIIPAEGRSVHERLGDAALGKAFLLQGGDCATDNFKEFNGDHIGDTFSTLLQMATVLMFGGQVPVIKVARMAGQFGKTLPSCKGDSINGDILNEESRFPDPQRAYGQSAATLNLLRSLAAGGFAAMKSVIHWNLVFAEHQDRYQELANQVDEALGFMEAFGVSKEQHPIMARSAEFWTSHECLLLPYEQSFTRLDSATGLYYDCSAHMLCYGESSSIRQLDGAHLEFLGGISNPLGIKVSDKMEPSELVKLIDILNPANLPGRITIIGGMGSNQKLRVKLPELIRAVHGSKQIVTWVCDPMYGNIKAPCGLKSTRPFDRVLAEVDAFFDVHDQEGSHPGGIHLQMTGGRNVTEWIGGSCTGLNASQSLELAFMIAERFRKRRCRNHLGFLGM